MIKWKYLLLCLVILCVVLIIKDIYYPPLPIDSISKKDVLEYVNISSGKIVKISEENGYYWYIAEVSGEKTYEDLKSLIEKEGWRFKKQVNEGLVFESKQGEFMVSSRMWTKKYIIFNFPKDVFNKN